MNNALLFPLFLLFATPALAGWNYKEQIDPFTDDTYFAAYGSSAETYLGDPTYLSIICYQGTLKIRVISREIIGSGKAAAQYRFDKFTPVVKAFKVYDKNKLEIPAMDNFLKRMKAGSKFVIEIRLFDGSDSLSTISLRGSKNVISRVEKNCGR